VLNIPAGLIIDIAVWRNGSNTPAAAVVGRATAYLAPFLSMKSVHRPAHLAVSAEVMEIAHLPRLQLENDRSPVLLYCDMFSGEVGWMRPGRESAAPTVLAWLSNPCYVAPCDIDGQ
jgi:hypothetical protein